MQKLITCLTLGILTLLLSCQKGSEEQDGITTNNKLIVAAQQYFNQRLTKPVDPVIKQLGPMAWYQRKQPHWGQAVTFEVDGKPVVEAPLLVDGQAPLYTLENPAFGSKGTITAKNGVTKVLFFKHEDGSLHPYVLKLIADQEYYAANKTTYQNLSLGNLKNGYSGFVMITDWNDQVLDSYRMEQGKVVATTKVPVSNSPNARSVCQPICQNVCVGVSMPCCIMSSNPGDYCCTNTYMNCYPQCFYLCVPDQPVVEPIVGGSGSGNGSNNNTFTGSYMYDPISNPIKSRIFKLTGSVMVTNKCQHQALRTYLQTAENLELDYINKIRQCAIQNNLSGDAVEKLAAGVSFAAIAQLMAGSPGQTFRTACRGLVYGQALNNLNTTSCISGVQGDTDVAIQRAYSDYSNAFSQPCP